MPFATLCAAANVLFDAIFLIIFNTIFSTPSLHCCPHKTDLPYMVRQALRFALQHRLVFFQYSSSSFCNSPVAFSSVLQRFLPVLAAFSTAVFCLLFFLARVRYFFRNGICLCSLRFPHVYLPAFAVFSAAVFFLFFFVTLIAVFYTCVLIVFCFLQRCFAIFDFLFSKIKKSLEILTKTFDIA